MVKPVIGNPGKEAKPVPAKSRSTGKKAGYGRGVETRYQHFETLALEWVSGRVPFRIRGKYIFDLPSIFLG
ncbi:MAG: hypothetical protein V9G98_27835 [Candidatus Competibacter sp.]